MSTFASGDKITRLHYVRFYDPINDGRLCHERDPPDCSTCARAANYVNPGCSWDLCIACSCGGRHHFHIRIINPDAMSKSALTAWAVRRATRSYSGSDARWAELAESGATDAELDEAILREFHNDGATSAPGQPTVHSGKRSSGPWIKVSWRHGVPGDDVILELKGAKIRPWVRRVWGVYSPDQLAMF